MKTSSYNRHSELIREFMKQLNIEVPEFTLTVDDSESLIGTYNIPVESVGALAPMFKSITVELRGIFIPVYDITKMVLKYSYKHSQGGSNGLKLDYIVSEEGIQSEFDYWSKH